MKFNQLGLFFFLNQMYPYQENLMKDRVNIIIWKIIFSLWSYLLMFNPGASFSDSLLTFYIQFRTFSGI